MLKKEIVKVLKSVGIETSEEKLEVPREEFGDVAFTCFELARKENKNPQEIAEEIVKKIKPKGLIEKVEAKSGYVNFFFNYKKIAEIVLKSIYKNLKLNIGKKKRVMIEYSTPNPVHPMHIGHARTTFLGDALANILDFLGYKITRANYMNDTGLQVAKLVTSYILWAKGKKPKGKPDFWLWKYYVKFHEELAKDSKIEEKAREILRKFEVEKDEKIIALWNKVVRWCTDGFKETYEKVGINFDVYFFESKFRDAGKKIVEDALEKNIAFKSPENVTVASLERYGLPNCTILRSDGTGLYITSDLGLTVHKFEKYRLDKAIWVVSSQQDLYFKQLFKILELLGYAWVKKCHHFSFEHVVLPEGKMSSREGRAIMLDEVVEKLTKLALKEVEKRNPKLSEKEKQKLAEKIGVGALKYAIVKIEPEDKITFNWKQMLRFEGDTGPYLQYAYTRCLSILKKAKEWKESFVTESLTKEEKNLIKALANFSEVVQQAANDLRPHYICNYAYKLATTFSNFYEACPVLRAENKELRNFRLTLVEATKKILKNSLNLIGIEVVEKM